MRLLQSAKPLRSTQRNSTTLFREHIQSHSTFRSEVPKLNKLKFEMLSIALTGGNLKQDLEYFTADDVYDTFKFDIRKERREQV